jgi:hypothetical protein
MPAPKDATLPPFARAILELFQTDMRAVRFPDLSHDSLTAMSDEVNAAQFEVECVEAALASARGVLQERAQALVAHAARGLSYARIYAADHPALSERIAEIEQLTREQKTSADVPGKKRGRPRKGEAVGAELFANTRENAAQDEAAA